MTPRRTASLLAACLLGLLLLACASGGQLTSNSQARWACPSPTPLPWGPDAPPKEIIRHTRPISEGGDWEERIDWKQWEQEYPTPGLAVYPSPTPYGFSGTTFTFGQRVEVAPLHVLVDASAGPQQADGSQLHYVTLGWRNPTGRPVPIDYTTQLTLRSVTTLDGGQRADGWIVTDVALRQARQELLPDNIPPGESTVRVPILAPPGRPRVIELRVLLGRAPGEATPAPEATPTPNTELRRPSTPLLVLQWTDSRLSYFGAPPCGDPGAVTEWGAGPKPAAPIAAPAGSSRLIAIALAQVGKPYIWGAKGPNAFDCSGLATWSYAQIGIRIPQGTAGQWPNMRPVGRDQLQPGDLAFMNTDEPPQADITHVGLLADVDADGTWDLIHAASPWLGVRVDYDVFGSRYYAPRLRGFRTAR